MCKGHLPINFLISVTTVWGRKPPDLMYICTFLPQIYTFIQHTCTLKHIHNTCTFLYTQFHSPLLPTHTPWTRLFFFKKRKEKRKVSRLRGSVSPCLLMASWKGSGCQVGLDTVTVAVWKYLVIVIFFLLRKWSVSVWCVDVCLCVCVVIRVCMYVSVC